MKKLSEYQKKVINKMINGYTLYGKMDDVCYAFLTNGVPHKSKMEEVRMSTVYALLKNGYIKTVETGIWQRKYALVERTGTCEDCKKDGVYQFCPYGSDLHGDLDYVCLCNGCAENRGNEL